MNTEFEVILLNNDILYEKANLFILKDSIINSSNIYFESDDAISEAEKQQKEDEKKVTIKERIIAFIKAIIEKIKGIFQHASSSISGVVEREDMNTIISNVKKAIKEDPELSKKEVTINDIRELKDYMQESRKLQELTIDKLSKCTTKDEVEKIVEDYVKERDKKIEKRKNRKKVIKTTLGIVATGGALVAIDYAYANGYLDTLNNNIRNSLNDYLKGGAENVDNKTEGVVHDVASAYTKVSHDVAEDALYYTRKVRSSMDDIDSAI